MAHGGHIPWGRLIAGGLLALLALAAAGALIGPLVYAYTTGGGSVRIRTDAMAPTLLPGDWVLVEPLPEGVVPKRGAIVVLRAPGRQGETRVLRVVGLPGERVQVRGGVLHVNGSRAEMERVGERVVPKHPAGRGDPVPACLNDPVPIGGACRQEIWLETLPDGTSEPVINARGRFGVLAPGRGRGGDNTRIVLVPAGHLYLMGDNRDNVEDSRTLGPVPLDGISGRVWLIHTSIERKGRLFRPRWERFFREVG